MRILNNTGMLAGYTMGMEPSGQECLVIAIKGTFSIPKIRGEAPRLLDEQVPLVEADTFSGEPGFSAPLFEVDYAPIKHHCDVTLVGSAYAPGGQSVDRVMAGFKVGNVSKLVHVLGDRYWIAGAAGYQPSKPSLFTKRAVTYDIAFGGVDRFHADEARHDACMDNPVGIGYHKILADDLVDNTPAPSTEEVNVPITNPDGIYRPMAFGPLGRGWQARFQYGGTYDQQWLEDTFPFLPADFNELYYQSAPADQQMPYLQGGETVSLLNVTEDGKRSFQIPTIDMPVVFFRKKGGQEETRAVLDTLVLDTDNERFSLTWRASIKLKNNAFEVPEALVGKASRGWWRARTMGKTYYPSLNALMQTRKAEREERADTSVTEGGN